MSVRHAEHENGVLMMHGRYSAAIALWTANGALGGVFSYEGDSFPDQAGWDIVQIWCGPEQWVEGGWFYQHVKLCPGVPPPGGQQASYTRSLDEFVGANEFFVEWRMETDGDRSELPWGGGASFTVWSTGPVDYRFSIARDQAELNRDNLLPIVVVGIEAGVPHVYRLELYGDQLYVWFVDGVLVDSGRPEGPYPAAVAGINIRAKAAWLPNTTKWDYIRYGTIPADGSGDFDSDGLVDLADYYFVHECLSNNGPDTDAGPGCRFADFDADTDVDLTDLAAFQIAFTG